MAYDPTGLPRAANFTALAIWGCLNKLDEQTLLMREVYFKAKDLATVTVGGADYTSNFAALWAATNCVVQGMEPHDIRVWEVVAAYQQAVGHGAVMPATDDLLSDATKCLKNYSTYQLELMSKELDNLLGKS